MDLNRLELSLMARDPAKRGASVNVQRRPGAPVSAMHLMCAAYWTEHPLDTTHVVSLFVGAPAYSGRCYFCDLPLYTDPMNYWRGKSWATAEPSL